MKLRYIYKRVKPSKNLKISYDKTSKGRPAWIDIKGLPKEVNFISTHFGKKGKEGTRIQFYKTYLPKGLFIPINYTKEEMKKFYDRFSKQYNFEVKKTGFNINAAKFLLSKLKKHIKKGEMLDLGCGTGIITEIFIKEGYFPATLVDFSPGMLNKAKKRKNLQGCEFIKADVRKLNLHKKFDLILSFFSFGSSSYFQKEELDKILIIANKHLKKRGIIAVIGHFGEGLFERKFHTIEKGIYVLDEKKGFYTDYFIGRKRG